MLSIEVVVWISKIFTAYNFLISLPLYVLVLISIWRKRRTPPYDSTYFIIFMAQGSADILGFLVYQSVKFVSWEWDFILFLFAPFNQPTIISQIANVLIWAFGLMQYQFTLFMQFNRYFCILFPSLFDKIGTRKITYTILLILYCSCFIEAIPIWFANCQVQAVRFYPNGLNTDDYIIIYLGPVFVDSAYAFIYNWVWKMLVYLIVITGIVFYPLILLKLNNQLKRSNHNKQQVVLSLKVMYSACCLFLANLMLLAIFIVRDNVLIPDPNLKYTYGFILNITTDIYYMYNAYSIMITSKEIRLTVKKMLLVGGSSAVHVSPMNNLKPNNHVVRY